MPAARPRNTTSICLASSRVGVRTRAPVVPRAVEQLLHHRQQERGRLAGAGLGGGDEVAAGLDRRNRLGLDGGGSVITEFEDVTQEGGRQTELLKWH